MIEYTIQIRKRLKIKLITDATHRRCEMSIGVSDGTILSSVGAKCPFLHVAPLGLFKENIECYKHYVPTGLCAVIITRRKMSFA